MDAEGLIKVNTLSMRKNAETCSCCEEELCTICGDHFGICPHPSEFMDDEFEYLTIGGELYARKKLLTEIN